MNKYKVLSIVLLVAMLAMAVLPGCAAPTPEVIKETVEVPVEVTRVVEKEVIKEVPVPEAQREWELINPQGAILAEEKVDITPHPNTLEGKTVALLWNGKAGGDIFQDRVAELLIEQVKNVKVIKLYEVLPETAHLRQNAPKATLDEIAALKPDLVIGAQGD